MANDAIQVETLMAGLTDTSGNALAGGLVHTYSAGTTTNKATYTESDKSVAAANPVVLDAYGRALIFADGIYKFVVKDSDGNTLYTWDNLEYKLQSVILPEVAAPSGIANKGQITSFDDGGDTELRYTDDSGNDVQLTKDGAINAMAKLGGASVDEQVTRWNGVGGDTLQGSALSITDAGLATLDGVYRGTAQTTPSTSASHVQIYGKTVSGVIELHTLDSDGNEVQLTSGGSIDTTNTQVSLGPWEARALNTVYQAATDGYVLVYRTEAGGGIGTLQLLTDANTPPTTARISVVIDVDNPRPVAMMPVLKDDYWKVTLTTGAVTALWWVPQS